MNFDIVIGNPPYNNDLYLDFVHDGYSMLKDDGCMIMITPAKWQAKGGKKNDDFREKIVPHMREIVYFPDEKSIFNISEHGGVCYYAVNKGMKPVDIAIKTVINKKETTDNISHKDFDDCIILDNNARKIVNKIRMGNFVCINRSLNSPRFSYFCGKMACEILEDPNGKFYLRDNSNYFRISNSYIKNTSEANQYKVYHNKFVDNSTVCHIYEPCEVASRNWCLLGFGSKDKCKSIKSYYECRLIWYLVVVSQSGSTTNKEAWRFVPDPGAFDHIFTDAELYKKYNLTQEEINIIESVIKERK